MSRGKKKAFFTAEIGIATDEAHRHKGLATGTGTAVIRHARAHNIHQIGWHCWADNTASAATARKLGFRLIAEAPVWLHWNAACVYGRLGEETAVFHHLKQAIAAGFGDWERLHTTPHLTSIQDTDAWQSFINALYEVIRPEHQKSGCEGTRTQDLTDVNPTNRKHICNVIVLEVEHFNN